MAHSKIIVEYRYSAGDFWTQATPEPQAYKHRNKELERVQQQHPGAECRIREVETHTPTCNAAGFCGQPA